jgi:hypothetical protein
MRRFGMNAVIRIVIDSDAVRQGLCAVAAKQQDENTRNFNFQDNTREFRESRTGYRPIAQLFKRLFDRDPGAVSAPVAPLSGNRRFLREKVKGDYFNPPFTFVPFPGLLLDFSCTYCPGDEIYCTLRVAIK